MSVNRKTNSTTRSWIIGPLLVAAFLLWGGVFAHGQETTGPVTEPTAQDVGDLNQQIADKRAALEQLKQQSQQYQTQLDQSSTRVKDLKGQLTNIENQIALTNIQIQTKETEIEALNLEMTGIQQSIDAKAAQMDEQKTQLAASLKALEENSRTPLLNLVLSQDKLSAYYDQAQAYARLSDDLQSSVQTVQHLREDLQAKQNQLAEAKEGINDAKRQLEVNRQAAGDQAELQGTLLADAQKSADQYSDLLQQSVKEEEQANATISALERQVQLSLNGGSDEPQFTSTGFIWPVHGTIAAYFHDPTYPFSCRLWKNPYCMEHSGLDISTPQGTPVRATADGVVSVISDQGFYYDANGRKLRSALNFVGIVHGDGISSRYLHLSVVYAKPDQFIKQGDVIGLSGGLPGTAGAGGITTGAHLHFEIRVNGIPDDPLRYLQ